MTGPFVSLGWRSRWRSLLASNADPFVAERVAIARKLEVTCAVALLGLVVLLPFRTEATWVDAGLYLGIAALLGLMALLRPHLPAAAGLTGGVGFIGLVTGAAWFREGLASGVTSAAYSLAVVVGGLLWGPGKTLVLAVLASGGAALLAWKAPRSVSVPLRSWAELTAVLFTMALFVELLLAALAERVSESKASRKRFAQLFDGSPDALVVMDKSGLVHFVNRTARTLFDGEVTPNRKLTEVGPFRDQALLFETIATSEMDTGVQRIGAIDAAEDPLSLLSGRYHELTLSSLCGTSGELKAMWLLTVRDVTERVSAARARRELERQLARSKSLEALGRLAGGVAHDFNNLLTVILGTTDLMLQATNLDGQQRDDLSGIRTSATQAAELTSQLLAFGRKQILSPTVFCPTDALFQLQPLLHRLIPSNITLLFNPAPHVGRVRLDPARLDQVIVNLVTNACDSMPGGGTLTLETGNVEESEPAAVGAEREPITPGPYVRVVVRDTGTGMSEDVRARIFEPFFTTKGLGKGTGLGLATVFGIVRQSGGHIRVHSEEGRGSEFELLFPHAASSKWERPEQSSESGRTRPLRVLVVDDNVALRSSLARMLEDSGHLVSVVSNADDVLVSASGYGELDLLIAEEMGGGASGAELSAALRAHFPELRVLLVSNRGDAARRSHPPVRATVLSRPFTRGELDQKLDALFNDLGPARYEPAPSEPLTS